MTENKKTGISDQKILKAVLLLRRCGNRYQTKEEQIAEQKKWLRDDPEYAGQFDDWIASLKEDLAKTPEQKEREAEEFRKWLEKCDAEEAHKEYMSRRQERDEWDDYWADAARSVGAVCF